MTELTREQDAVAEAMAEKYGRCLVRPQSSGGVLLIGLSVDGIEMEYRAVQPDGSSVSAEHQRRAPSLSVVTTEQGRRGRLIS